jgi:uncharacterized membrane protein YraQ (UPF0718 family)
MPVAAILATLGPAVAKLGAGKVTAKGAGFAVRAISGVKTKAAEILSRKKDKAQQRAEEAKAKAAQLAALAGGTTYSSKQPESMAEKLAFGASVEKVKSENKKQNQNQQMEKVTEFFKKNWMYVLGGVVVLMFLKKKR